MSRAVSAIARTPAAAAASSVFKAYDVRGRVPDELDEELAHRIGQAFAAQRSLRRVVIGRDVRLSSPALAAALAEGLRASGTAVLDLGPCGTEEVYFATRHLGLDAGVMVTASHNPPDWNGMKFVLADARPVSWETGLAELAARVAAGAEVRSALRGGYRQVEVRGAYVEHVLGTVDRGGLAPLRVVVNAGNGCAGPVFDALAASLPLRATRLQHEPDGRFPNGVPNPMLTASRTATAAAVVAQGADLGIAWDGDFDRCFLFDETGRFIDGYYIVGLLAQSFLAKQPGASIVHDPRLVWNTRDIIERAGGVPVLSRCGHPYMKEAMRGSDAVYGGEMSAHHYFRAFGACDSGMIPWLLIVELLTRSGRRLSQAVDERMQMFPISGEQNRKVGDGAAVLRTVAARYRGAALETSRLDGLSMEFPDWRFNLRLSNTEALLRLNVETRGDAALLGSRTEELLALVGGSEG